MSKTTKNKLLVIIGPTASGKSNLAIKLAKKYHGEIISADSRQVYKNLDIGSGKVTKKEQKMVKHHLLDIVSPKTQFNVASYQKLATKTIKSIWNQKKLPILCGGSPLYIISVIEGWQFPKIKPNKNLRKQLEKKSTENLYKKLQKLDKKRAATIDRNNRRRLIRALEIIMTSKSHVPPLQKKPLNADILILGIQKDKKELKKLIENRLEKRLKRGLIAEVKKLKKMGVSGERLNALGLEYKYINLYLEDKISFDEMKKILLKRINDFSKRQITWFKKFPNVIWITNYQQANQWVVKWLKNPTPSPSN